MAAVDIQAARPAAVAAPRRQPAELPEGFWYSVKHRVLGPPLVTEQLKDQRLSRPLALGVLSCDGLSSAAYGTEEILRALLPFFGLAAFSLVLPMTLLILFGVVLVVLSYREVVSVYTRAGGSYVVARENFGPRVAQAGGTYTALVVVLFAVVKFTEGAWLIVIIFPVLVYTLIRLNRQYGKEAAILEDPGDDLHPHPPNYSRRVVLLLVDSYDLATIAAIRYAKSLHPSALRAVHFSLDSTQAAKLRQRWLAAGLTIPLDLADCPDRRLGHAAAELAAAEAAAPGTHVTVVLPRRSYPPLAGRLLHDHTADRIARRVSHVRGAVATIIPFDVRHKVETIHAGRTRPTARREPDPPTGADPIGSLRQPGRAVVQGRLHTAEVRAVKHDSTVLACEVADSTGELTAVFYGRTQIAGLEPGRRVRLRGMVGIGADGRPAMINPAYDLLGSALPPSRRGGRPISLRCIVTGRT